MSVTLACESCTTEVTDVGQAFTHVSLNPTHVLSGQYPDGMTTRVYNAERYPDDGYEDHPDTGCATCDGGGCGDCR